MYQQLKLRIERSALDHQRYPSAKNAESEETRLMILCHALGIEGRVLDLLPIVQEGSVPGTLANFVSRTFNHGGLEISDGLLSICTFTNLDESVPDLTGIRDGVIQALTSLVGHGMGSVADERNEAVVICTCKWNSRDEGCALNVLFHRWPSMPGSHCVMPMYQTGVLSGVHSYALFHGSQNFFASSFCWARR